MLRRHAEARQRIWQGTISPQLQSVFQRSWLLCTRASFSADGTAVAFEAAMAGGRSLLVSNLQTGWQLELPLLSDLAAFSAYTWVQGSQQLTIATYTQDGRRMTVTLVDAAADICISSQHSQQIAMECPDSLSLSPSGLHAMAITRQKLQASRLQVIELRSGHISCQHHLQCDGSSPVWSSDGRKLAAVCCNSYGQQAALTVLDLTAGTQQALPFTTRPIAWQGDSLLCSTQSSHVLVTRPCGTVHLSGADSSRFPAQLSPDGTALAACSASGITVHRTDSATAQSWRLVNSLQHDRCAWAPDRLMLATWSSSPCSSILSLHDARSGYRIVDVAEVPLFERVIWSPCGCRLLLWSMFGVYMVNLCNSSGMRGLATMQIKCAISKVDNDLGWDES